MRPVTLLLPAGEAALAERFAGSGLVGAVRTFEGPPGASTTVGPIVESTETPYLLQVTGDVDPHPNALARMLQVASDGGAPLVYGDYALLAGGAVRAHPLADAQEGSLEDRFDLGPLRLWSVDALRRAGVAPELRWHAWYDLRLKTGVPERIAEPLGLVRPADVRASGLRVFDYLTASRESQIEAERVATAHLERIGARVGPEFRPFEAVGAWPVEASVVIPVKNRVRTVIEAVDSALSQEAPFEFDVIVVDNGSTDGTTRALRDRAASDRRLVHVVPDRLDLGIGGCWNVAAAHPAAGRYLVQLDSDDLYAGTGTLARMVGLLREERCGMAVGSYTLVDFALRELPPGLVDHREWTAENGPNNALRIGGLGAPRAFATELARAHPFPNASYGEDYAVALRISREYRVGRIYESLYLCRRWEDNSDADLAPEVKARYQAFKDRVRTHELRARRRA